MKFRVTQPQAVSIAQEVFNVSDIAIKEAVEKCTKWTREQFKKSIKPGDIVIPYKRPKAVAASGFQGRFATPINKYIQGSSFTSCKMVGRGGKSIIGYGVLAGHFDICSASLDKFLEQHEGLLVLRHKQMTDEKAKIVVDAMYEYAKEQPKYDKTGLFISLFHHWFGTPNKKKGDKEFKKSDSKKLICSSLVLKCYDKAKLKIDHDKEVGDKWIWPKDYITSKSFTILGGWFALSSGVSRKNTPKATEDFGIFLDDEEHVAEEGLFESIKNFIVEKWFGKKMEVPISQNISAIPSSMYDRVVDEGTHVTIRNFPFDWFRRCIKRVYGSHKLQNMLVAGWSWVGGRKIRIHKFFLPELVYILGQSNGGKKNQELIDEIVASTWLKDLVSTNGFVSGTNLSLVERDMKVKLFPWQEEFINLYDIKRQQAHLRGELLSFGCGLGKTITSLALMKSLDCDCVIVIAPKSTLEDVWVDHIQRFYKKVPRYYVVNKSTPGDADIYIFNYESMDKIDGVMKWIKTKKRIGIIADESHNFLKLAANRTQNLIKLRNDTNCQHTLLMSGTPVKALGVEVLPLLRVLDSFFDEEAEQVFRKAFGLNTTMGTDILHARMSLMMHRRKMEDVFELPEKTEEVIDISISNGDEYTVPNVKKTLMKYMEERIKFHKQRMPIYKQEWEECWKFFESTKAISSTAEWRRYKKLIAWLLKSGYNQFDRTLVQEVTWANQYEKDTLIPQMPKALKDKFLDCKSAIKYVNLKIQGEVLGYLDHIRSTMITSMLNGVDLTGIIEGALKKVIFFTSYVDTVETLNDILTKKGYNPVLVYGKTSNNATALINKFRSDDNVDCLIATMQTLATGVTLTEANTVVFLNEPWRQAIKAQASDRVWRIGQDTPCFIYTLHLNTGSKPNLSDRTADILDWSRRMTDAIVDNIV